MAGHQEGGLAPQQQEGGQGPPQEQLQPMPQPCSEERAASVTSDAGAQKPLLHAPQQRPRAPPGVLLESPVLLLLGQVRAEAHQQGPRPPPPAAELFAFCLPPAAHPASRHQLVALRL